MRTLAFIFLLIAVPLAGGSFQPTQDADFWKETKVDLAYAQTFFSDEICNTNEALFNSCVAAFEQAAAMLGSKEFASLLRAKFKPVNAVTRPSEVPEPLFYLALRRVEQLAIAANQSRELLYGAMINEQLRTFDNHAVLIPADKINAHLGGSAEDMTGIGIDDEVSARGVTIRRVYPNTPAEAAGLMPNDRILAIDGTAVRGGLKGIGSLKRLAKSPGQSAELIIERRGEKFKTNVPIGNLSLRNVTLEFAQFGKETFAVAQIRSFASGTADDLAQQLAFTEGKIKGLILDLRRNPGGSMEEAAQTMSLFSGEKKLVDKRAVPRLLPPELPLKTEFSEEDMETWRRGLKPVVYPNLPLVVLVDAASASASEMLSAALQDQSRAWIVGEVTFGKGSTQAVVGEPNKPKLRLIYTVSRYYRPLGAPLQLIGVTPNFIVPAEMNATTEERTFLREGEMYGRLLERESFPAWIETRTVQKDSLKSCLKKNKYVSRVREWFQTKHGYEDFQKSFALAVARCSTRQAD